MNTCRLRGEFEYLQYKEDNRAEVEKFIKDTPDHSIVKIDNYNLLGFCLFDKKTNIIKNNVVIVTEGDYLVKVDPTEITVYNEATFDATFQAI